MSKSKLDAHTIAIKRKRLLDSIHNTRPHDHGQSDSEESEEEDADVARFSEPPSSQPQKRSHSKSNKKALPLTIGPDVVSMNYEDTAVSHRSLHILHQVPTFKGIKTRVPEYFIIDAETGEEIPLTSQLKAITLLIRSYMATD